MAVAPAWPAEPVDVKLPSVEETPLYFKAMRVALQPGDIY